MKIRVTLVTRLLVLEHARLSTKPFTVSAYQWGEAPLEHGGRELGSQPALTEVGWACRGGRGQ